MSDSLIEQVRKAANRMPIIKTVEPLPVSTRQEGPYFPRKQDYDELDLRLVLAHMQAQQAVCDAAKKLHDGMNVGASDGNSHRHLSVQQWRWDAFKDALTALENLRSDNDGK